MADEKKPDLLRQAYSAATKRLREARRDEFNGFMQAEAKALGVEWSPRLTEEQKAAEQMAKLLSDHPSLLQQVLEHVPVGEDRGEEEHAAPDTPAVPTVP